MLEFASSFFMQKKCYLCEKSISKKYINEYICENCFKKLEKYKKKYDNDKYVCYEDFNINYAFIFDYQNYIRKLILRYKFLDKPYLGKVFSEFIIRDKKVCKKIKSYDIIIPVPMSKKSKRIRGYNKTEIISYEISKSIGIAYNKDILIKYKDTKKQSLLNRKERLENVKDAYKINNKFCEYLNGKKIILFDDIYTTGATVNECLKLIKKYNVKNILVLILAKD